MLGVMNADLHVHTCLSPCASLDMTPVKIVEEAIRNKLSLVAITDHNSAENAAAVIRAARGTDLCVIPGMEVTTAEEVHLVALFDSVEEAEALQEVVFENLLPGENDEDLFGVQVIANEFDEVEGFNKRLLIGSTTLELTVLVDTIHRLGGLAVAAHIDRERFGLIGQLGFIPEGLELDAVEVSRAVRLEDAPARFVGCERFPFITASDAHELAAIGASATAFRLARPAMDELRLALAGRDGRGLVTGVSEG